MASTSSTNVNEILPGLEDFLRSMLNSTHLDTDHRQIAAMYLDKLDQHSQATNQQSSFIDDQSLMNTDVISDGESDDFTDEEEQQTTPTITRHSSICNEQLYDSTKQESNLSHSQWYMDTPNNDYLQTQISNEHNDNSSSIMQSRLSIPSLSSSTIIADGLLLTYDKNHNWIWRYYVLDDYDLICFPADKKSRSTTEGHSDNNCSPLWVSDITNAKVHLTMIDRTECLCLYIGVAEAIYVRPSDPNQMNMWLKAFRDAASSSQKSRDHSKTRTNVQTLSRNARRMFAQFNRKKGQIVSHLLDQMANVTGVDDKTRHKHCELRGFLVISLDNLTFVTKYCTIVDGLFRVHKSRLSEQTDQQLELNHCTLAFPEERTRDIQFALINEQLERIFIRGNNIYSMGRLLNTLAKYVEITGSSPHVFKSNDKTTLMKKSKPSRVRSLSQVNEGYSSSTIKSLPFNIYRSASKLHDGRTYVLPTKQSSKSMQRSVTPIQQENSIVNETYDQPKSYNQLTSIDRNNNHVVVSPEPRERKLNDKIRVESPSPTHLIQSHRNSSSDTSSISSSRADPIFCIRSTSSASSQHRNRPRRPHPLPRRTSIDYMNKFTNLFTRTPPERHTSTQTSTSSCYNSNRIHSSTLIDTSTSKHVYDIPITIERSTKSFEETIPKPIDEDRTYDNISKSDGIGKFRFVIPFNHSARSPFTTIKPINSPSSSSSSSSTISSNSILPQTSSSSNNSNTNNNNNNNNHHHHRARLMTAV